MARPRRLRPACAVLRVAVELQSGERRTGERDPRVEAQREHVPDQWNRSEDLGERPQRHGHAEAADHERQQRPGRTRAPRAGSEHQERRRPAHDAEVAQGHLGKCAGDPGDLRHVDEVPQGAREERRGDAAPERSVRSEREGAAPVRQRGEDHAVRSPDGECGGEKEESGQARRGEHRETSALFTTTPASGRSRSSPAQADPQRREEHAEGERLRMSRERGPGEDRRSGRDGARAALRRPGNAREETASRARDRRRPYCGKRIHCENVIENANAMAAKTAAPRDAESSRVQSHIPARARRSLTLADARNAAGKRQPEGQRA